ncbi:MAG: L-rhamnose mutarotase [Verrucomicrobiota bacterium]
MSPYETRLNQEAFRRVAVVAAIRSDAKDSFMAELAQKPDSLDTDLAKVGITHLHLYQQSLGDRELVFVYFEMEQLEQDAGAQKLQSSSLWWKDLEAHLEPHPRATPENTPWQRAELINVIADNTKRERKFGQAMGLAAGLKPESELWYRTLHQTNWPGVIDQMARSHYQNWTTFMIEWGETLYLLTHVEYLGTDKATDDAAMAADPITQRWWTHTEPCLYSLVGEEGAWASMDKA